MFRSLLVLASLCASTVHAEPARALIWAGGATPEAGAEALRSFEADSSWKDRLVLAPGYPRLIESKTLTGLKPGFHVVLLGVCQPDAALVPLSVLKSTAPKVYSRAVQVEASALACPKLAGAWKLSGSERAGSMTTLLLTNGADRFSLLTLLQDGAEDVVDFLPFDEGACTGERGFEVPKLSVAGEAISVELTCYFPGCTTLSSQTDTWRFEVKGKRLKRSVREGKYVRGECD